MKKGLAVSAFIAVHNLVAGVPAASAQDLQAAQSAEPQHSINIRDFCDRQFTLIGDTNHYDMDVQSTLYSSQTISDLKQCEVNQVFLEIDKFYQNHIDDVANGVITPEEYADKFTFAKSVGTTSSWSEKDFREKQVIIGSFIHEANQNGIHVHAIDDKGVASFQIFAMEGESRAAFNAWTKDMNREDKEAVQKWMDGNAGPMTREIALKAMENLQKNNEEAYNSGVKHFLKSEEIRKELNELRLNDTHLKHEIDMHMKPGDKAAIIYGNGHLKSENGLQTLLGREKSRWIVVGNDFDQGGAFHYPDAIMNPSSKASVFTPRSTAPAPAMSTIRRP